MLGVAVQIGSQGPFVQRAAGPREASTQGEAAGQMFRRPSGAECADQIDTLALAHQHASGLQMPTDPLPQGAIERLERGRLNRGKYLLETLEAPVIKPLAPSAERGMGDESGNVGVEVDGRLDPNHPSQRQVGLGGSLVGGAREDRPAEEGPRRNCHMHVLDLRVDMPAGQPGGPMRWRAELLQGGQDHPLPVGIRESEPLRGREGDGEASCSPADQVEVLGDLLGAPERHGASDRDGATFQHIAHRFPGAAMVFKIGAHCCADPKRRLPSGDRIPPAALG